MATTEKKPEERFDAVTLRRHRNGIRAGRELAVYALSEQIRRDVKNHDFTEG